jgi:sugar (pentulose or hexulose) kinase
MGAVAVLDVGKTNVKVALFAPDGAVLWERTQANAVLGGPPYPHADVEAIWSFALDALKDANRAHRISTIAPTAHGATGALVGEDALALPVMDYEFAGVDAIAERYAEVRPPFAQTLSPAVPVGLNLGRQLAWQAWRHPGEFAHARWLLMYPQYWAWRLTGIAALEATSLGAHTDLWRPRDGAPSSLVDALGLTPKLPPLRRAWDNLGPPTRDVLARTGLDPSTRVLAGVHDSNASLAPHLASRSAPFTILSTGTWVILMAVGPGVDALDPAFDMLANIDVNGRPTACARFMGGREYAVIVGGAREPPDADAIARVQKAGALALPCFAGQGGPFAARAGAIQGDVETRDRAALATLYCALMSDLQLTKLSAGQGDLIIEGSFAANPSFARVLAALRPGQRVRASVDSAGTARGAALLAQWPAAPQPDASVLVPHAPIGGLGAYRERWLRAVAAS